MYNQERMALIELTNIHKTYRDDTTTPVLHGINLKIEAGEFCAIMGPSGSGKSTLMNIIGLLDKPSRGQYNLNGHLASKLGDKELARLRRQSIGFVFQSFNLLARISVAANVMLPMVYDHVPAKERKERSQKLLTQVGLGDRANYKPNQLSGGEMQRVAIARALANQPSLVLADEPTGNLDSKNGKSVMSLLQKLNQGGTTIVVVTHDPNIAKFAHRKILVYDGKIKRGKS